MERLMQRVNKPRAPDDGFGWFVEYVSILLHWYPTFTLAFIMDELPMEEGWIWWGKAIVDEPVARFAGAKVVNGYVKQFSDELFEQARAAWLAGMK